MLLTHLSLTNFRCYEAALSIPMHRLTVFIGENDSGKTALLEALALLLTNKNAAPSDFRAQSSGAAAPLFSISGVFELEPVDTLPEDYRTLDGERLELTKHFSGSGMRCVVSGRGFAETRWNTFLKQPAGVQRELLEGIGVTPGSNSEQRTAQFEAAVAAGTLTKQSAELEVSFIQLLPHLPRFEMVASTEYRNPDTMVQRTLQAVVDDFVRPEDPETRERSLLPEFQSLRDRITAALNTRISQIEQSLRRVHSKLVSVAANPYIDFSRSVTAVGLLVDIGDGAKPLASFGEGTKKKLWMGLLDWERQTQSALASPSVIRGYDEPDVNLDYGAERRLFLGIIEATSRSDSRTQAIVCTHAVTLVDRAPGRSINLIRVEDDGKRTILYIEEATDGEVRQFLETVGRSVGLSNSALFYERAFLVVEGESEENALPLLYRHLYGHSLIEDGVVLINLHSVGAWKAILKVLQQNKAAVTVLMLDQDGKNPESSGRITEEALSELGFGAGFLQTSCFYIGTKEFEDAFRDDDIVAVLNAHWPKASREAWTENDVRNVRDTGVKFSDDLIVRVRTLCLKERRQSARKPDFAERLGAHCQAAEQVPEVIRTVFTAVRSRAGCDV